ncbi:MAG: PKD domain-containing protein [Bacteroidales bacterium]|nr:PKD domain-containing protein [Bacteroidales bacterium]
MKFFRITIFILFILPLSLNAQRTANHWFFNIQIGIDFNSGDPVAEPLGQIGYYDGGPGCMSDTNGNLLFYTDGVKIWNRLHQVMLNGDNILGSRSASQSAIIFLIPGSQTKYYLFTVGDGNNLWGLKYHIVDMNLDGGLGGVTDKNISLTAATWAEDKLTSIRHANGKDFWVITRIFNDDKYASFLVTSSGVNPTPVLSLSRYIPNTCSTRYPMKISPNGKMLLCPFAGYPQVDPRSDVEVCDFDNQTGIVDFKFVMPDETQPGMGCGRIEFSPDSKLLYRVCDSVALPPAPDYELGLLYQYDLSQSDSLSFMQSRQIVARGSFGTGIQLAPDGKIYMQSNCTYNGTPNYCNAADSLSVINKPWIRGAGCDVQQSVFYLQYGHTNLGEFPNFMQEQLYRFVWTGGTCAGVPFNFRHRFIPEPDSIHWDFGDPGSGVANTSTAHNPTHIFSAGGTYEVYTYVKYPNGRIEETSREVEVLAKPYPNLGPDTLVCLGADVTLTAGSGFAGYFWNGAIMPGNPTYLATDTGTYIVRVKNGWLQFRHSIRGIIRGLLLSG